MARLAAIGMFDGVHSGHRHLLDIVRREAAKRGLQPAAVTFSCHPSALLRPDNQEKLLSGVEDKAELLRHEGMEVIMLDFTPELRAMTSRQFIEMLRTRYGVEALVVGFNNRFGSDRNHRFEDYRRFGNEIGVEVIRATEFPGNKVSSSIIRSMIAEGDVEAASKGLGRDYALTGTVVAGRQLGRQLGFPTANIAPVNALSILPASGVYAAYVTDGERPALRHKAMVNIGRRPTVNSGTDMTIEVHILDFKGNLYGHTLSIEFHSRIRPERHFPSLEALTSAIATDAAVTRRILP